MIEENSTKTSTGMTKNHARLFHGLSSMERLRHALAFDTVLIDIDMQMAGLDMHPRRFAGQRHVIRQGGDEAVTTEHHAGKATAAQILDAPQLHGNAAAGHDGGVVGTEADLNLTRSRSVLGAEVEA